MALLDRLYDDMKAAMKSGDKERLTVLRMTISELKKEQIDSGKTLDEATEIALVQRAIKKRRESAEAFEKFGRADSAKTEAAEADILAEYLPQQLSDDELAAIVADVVKETGAASPRDMGKVMGKLLARCKGQVDGARAKDAVMKALGG